MLPPRLQPWRLVSPDGTLRILREEEALEPLCVANNLTLKYMKNILGLCRSEPKLEHKGWQVLEKVRWLQHMKTGEYVPVVGKVKNFLKYAWQRDDMPFSEREFQQLLAGTLKTKCLQDERDTYKEWALRKEAPSIVAGLPDGASLRGLIGSLPATQPAMAQPVPLPVAAPQEAAHAVPPVAAATAPLPCGSHAVPMAWARQCCAGGCGRASCEGHAAQLPMATAEPLPPDMSLEAAEAMPFACVTPLPIGGSEAVPLVWAQQRCGGARGLQGPLSLASSREEPEFGTAEVVHAIKAAVNLTAQTYETQMSELERQHEEQVAHLQEEVRAAAL